MRPPRFAPLTTGLGLSRWRHALITMRNAALREGDSELYWRLVARVALATRYLKRVYRTELEARA
jgi:hypothetical protein